MYLFYYKYKYLYNYYKAKNVEKLKLTEKWEVEECQPLISLSVII